MPPSLRGLSAGVQCIDRFQDALTLVSGTVRDVGDGLSAFTVIRDEMFYLPAFLDYHRGLGVRQFLFLDDGSTDGSRDYLAAQSDCVVISSVFAYADLVESRDLSGRTVQRRACFFFKQFIPDIWLKGRAVLGLDADEFLLLPPAIANADRLLSWMRSFRIGTVAASLLEFFPACLAELRHSVRPADLADLIAGSPCYDHAPLTRFRWRGGLSGIRSSASTRIFRAAGIREPYVTTPFKSVVYFHDANWIIGSHRTRRSPDRRLLLTLAHFKFTHDLFRRTEMALSLGSYSQGSRKYQCYQDLFDKDERGEVQMLSDCSRRYSTTDQLLDAGLMRCCLPGLITD